MVDHTTASAAGLIDWWQKADDLWRAYASPNRGVDTESLLGNVDYLNKLSAQFPTSACRVVYTKAGNTLTAAVITDERAVIDHNLYWAHATSPGEALYLCAILNSKTLLDEITGYQPVGLFGPRHFDKYVFEVPWPVYDRTLGLHQEIAAVAEKAAECSIGVGIDGMGFQKARGAIRLALDDAGLSSRVNGLVLDLLTAP
jgi:hypothetical protein